MKERLKGFLTNKLFIIFLLFFIFGTINIFAGNIIVNEEGIQSDNYYSESGDAGMTQNVYCRGIDGQNYTFFIRDGLIVNFTQGIIEYNESQGGGNSSFPSDGLVHYYKLDETSGTQALDSVQDQGTNQSLSFGGSPTWETNGKMNGGLNVSSGNYLITNPLNNVSTTCCWSISMWVFETDSAGSDQGIFGSGESGPGNNIFTKQAGGGYWWTVDGGRTKGATAYIPGNWVFIVATINSSGSYIFKNGSMDISAGFTPNTDVDSWANFFLGRNIDYSMTGTIDEVGIWDRSLTETEISGLYNEGNGLTYS